MIAPIIRELRATFDFSISSDTAGLFGNAESSLEFWREVFEQTHTKPPTFGMELLAWRHLSIENTLHNPTIRTHLAGLHGRIGTRISLPGSPLQNAILKKKIVLYNEVLHRTVPLLKTLTETTEDWSRKPYLLLHEPEVELLFATNALEFSPRSIAIGVENSIDDPDLGRTRTAVARLQELGFQAVIVFDLAHFLTTHNALHTPAKLWEKLLSNFSESMMLHLPLGLNVSDSLDFAATTDEMLAELSSAIADSNSYCTIEFQLDGVWPLYAQPKYLPSVKEFAKQWITKLMKAKVIRVN